MAVDTAERRFSMMDFCGSTTGIVNIVPDGTIGAGNRMHFLGLYSGLNDSDEAGAVGTIPKMWHLRDGFGRHSLKGKGYSR